MAAESSHDGTIPPSEETKKTSEMWVIDITNMQPLIEPKKGQEQQTRHETRIEKVDKELRDINSYKPHFDPSLVSFGPYHHNKVRSFGLGPKYHKKVNTESMETYKRVAADWFISLAGGGERITADDDNETYQKFLDDNKTYQKFLEKVENLSPKDVYPSRTQRKYNNEQLMMMMFLDGCFVLNFIHLVADRSDRTSGLYECSSHLNQRAIIRDMFLLENQIPYTVLKALMSLTGNESSHKESIIKFISMVFLPSCEFHMSLIGCIRALFSALKEIFTPTRKDVADTECRHLLDLLRAKLIGRGSSLSSPQGAQSAASPSSPQGAQIDASPSSLKEAQSSAIPPSLKEAQSAASPSSPQRGYWYYCFRPIRELKAAGIQVRRSKSILLKDVKFKQGPLNSHLEIPPIIVDDLTKTRLLNLVAYEKCSDGQKDRTVTSYICFLGSLIYNVDDVEELQSKNILLNRLSSDQDVVDLFKELAIDLSPDCNAYDDVIEGIHLHFNRNFNHQRVQIGEWIGQFIRTYCTSPWKVTSLFAAFVLLLLTLLQTIYTIWGFYKTS